MIVNVAKRLKGKQPNLVNGTIPGIKKKPMETPVEKQSNDITTTPETPVKSRFFIICISQGEKANMLYTTPSHPDNFGNNIYTTLVNKPTIIIINKPFLNKLLSNSKFATIMVVIIVRIIHKIAAAKLF